MKTHWFRKSIGLVILLVVAVWSCAKSGQNETAQNVVINIDDYQVRLPKAEGYDEFKAGCITCHSLRYIEMQPDFPPKTWEVIVNKMRKNFGAPIPDSTATKIVNYLAAVKGKM